MYCLRFAIYSILFEESILENMDKSMQKLRYDLNPVFGYGFA
jgi:hypothetical protein